MIHKEDDKWVNDYNKSATKVAKLPTFKPTEHICPVGCMAFKFKERVAELESENDRLHSEIRDFKLLVREYFQAKSRAHYEPKNLQENYLLGKKRDDLEKRILSELEEFTWKDVAELPFRSEEDILP